jgi:hypothetical protein
MVIFMKLFSVRGEKQNQGSMRVVGFGARWWFADDKAWSLSAAAVPG